MSNLWMARRRVPGTQAFVRLRCNKGAEGVEIIRCMPRKALSVSGTAIHAALKRQHGWTGSYSAVRRLVANIRSL